MSKRKFILMMGGPGSGKGTQSKNLSLKNKRILHVSTGDLIRNIIQDKSHPQFNQFLKHVQAGTLITDNEILEVLKNHLETINSRITTIILDGYPRTHQQADQFIETFGSPHLVLYLQVPRNEMKKRLLARQDNRIDDVEATIDKRLDDFEIPTLDVINRLTREHRGVTIEGVGQVQEISKTIYQAVLQVTDQVQRVNPWTLISTFWKAGSLDIYALSDSVRDTYGVDNFSIGFPISPRVYFLQSKGSVQQVLKARSHLNIVYSHFSTAAGLKYDFTAAEQDNAQLKDQDGRPNFWYLAHYGFKKATEGDKDRIPLLVQKHLRMFLQGKHIILDQAFERYFDSFWCDYLFGSEIDVADFTDLKHKIQEVMHYAFYQNRLKSLDPFYLTTTFYSALQAQHLSKAKETLRMFIMKARGGWLERFRNYLNETNQNEQLELSEGILARIIEDNMFDLFFEPDFLSGIIYEALVEMVNKQLNFANKEDRQAAYNAGMYRAYLSYSQMLCMGQIIH